MTSRRRGVEHLSEWLTILQLSSYFLLICCLLFGVDTSAGQQQNKTRIKVETYQGDRGLFVFAAQMACEKVLHS